MDIGYAAVETFIPPENYRVWSKLYHINEVISLDGALCPRVQELGINDQGVYMPGYGFIIDDLNLLLHKVKDRDNQSIQILAVLRAPESDCCGLLEDERFRFRGYDLLEDDTMISALTNCGGFDKAFVPADISEYGLIYEYNKAKQIQLALTSEYPNDEHADCTMWAIWRMESNPSK